MGERNLSDILGMNLVVANTKDKVGPIDGCVRTVVTDLKVGNTIERFEPGVNLIVLEVISAKELHGHMVVLHGIDSDTGKSASAFVDSDAVYWVRP